MSTESTQLAVHGMLLRAADSMTEDPIKATRVAAQEMLRRFQATGAPVLSKADHGRYVNVLMAVAQGNSYLSKYFEVMTDHLTSLVMPGLDDLRLVDNDTGEEILPGGELRLFPQRGLQETSPATFLGIRVLNTGRVQVEIEDGTGPFPVFSYRISAHVVGKDGKQVHRVNVGR